MTMTDAQRKRHTSLGMLMELYVPASNDYDMTSNDAAAIADNIRVLAQLGRSARWQGAINRWARMVLNSGINPASLRSSFLQGAIYAGHAID